MRWPPEVSPCPADPVQRESWRTSRIAGVRLAIWVLPLAVIGLAAAAPSPGSSVQYVTTPWGTRCQISSNQIICDTCEPGLTTDTAAGCPGPSLNEIAVDSSGAKQSVTAGGILPASPDAQQLARGQAYDINGWTISVGGWVRFTNDATGHGMAVAAQNNEFF